MNRWRHEAFKRLPSLRRPLQQEKGLYGFFHALYDELCRAYERNDEELIRSIFSFSEWCLEQPAGRTTENDVATAICVCFFEHLPENEKIRHDLFRHFDRPFLISMRDIFCYHGTEAEFEEIIQNSK